MERSEPHIRPLMYLFANGINWTNLNRRTLSQPRSETMVSIQSQLRKKAFQLSVFTVGYNLLEGLASIVTGSLVGSVALVGFGLDSFVESFSGGIMIWRFRHKNRITGREPKEESTAIRAIGYSFIILGAYVLHESVKKLHLREMPHPTLFGVAIALASIIVMPMLFYMKYKTGRALQSKSLMADSKETLACAFLSAALLLGLGLNYLFGLWWADPIVGLVIVAYLIKEGYETIADAAGNDD